MMQSLKCEDQLLERRSLCFPGVPAGVAIHAGEAEFRPNLEKHFIKAENNAVEKLIELKTELRTLENEAFWNRLMKGLADLCHAQFGFVSKRILVDDHDSAVEMPPIGEVGSCLMGVALYWNDGAAVMGTSQDYKYYAWGAPCSYMRHDKVFLCADSLNRYVTDNPNQLPFECEGYLGVPLFAEGKCFAHFGLMWTKEGLDLKDGLSWAFIEMVMHSLEDVIAAKLLSGQGFAKVNHIPEEREVPSTSSKVIPQEMVTPAQSLKPYAKSLSHELRTPMHGVVGMLDIMYATVQEQIEGQSSSQMLDIFKALKDNIETVQDSSKRAVEAADNVVYAYDLNMQIPDTPSHAATTSVISRPRCFDPRLEDLENNIIHSSSKRRRSNSDTGDGSHPSKVRHISPEERHTGPTTPQSPINASEKTVTSTHERTDHFETSLPESDRFEFPRPPLMTPTDTDIGSSPGARHCNVRELIPVVLQEALRVGGRPESAITEQSPLGERIVVRAQTSNGNSTRKCIQWVVEESVPDTVAMDERDLSKLISSIFLNAVKFTEDGNITIHTRLSPNGQHVFISIADTGSGIPEAFQSELFKPFAKGDHSLTRSKEGLGLGLLVAKGLARRSGGDIRLLRSSTNGPNQGTEFEICVPVDHSDHSSRAASPPGANPESMAVVTVSADIRSQDRSFSEHRSSSPSSATALATDRIKQDGLSSHKQLYLTSEDLTRSSLARRVSRAAATAPMKQEDWDRNLAQKYPLKFLIAEDNKINRKLLVTMLAKLGYKTIHEAFDGREAVKITQRLLGEAERDQVPGQPRYSPVDVILMDLWMPEMDGYEATETILAMYGSGLQGPLPIVLAVSADVTGQAIERATEIGMRGYMTKPYKLMDLQRLIVDFCGPRMSL